MLLESTRPALTVRDKKVTTGWQRRKLHPVQQAVVDHQGFAVRVALRASSLCPRLDF